MIFLSDNIDKDKFGEFIAELRREKGFTQKELAEKLFVSDKAVSKWERGQSLPDITLLNPLAEVLDVTPAELLNCGRIEEKEKIDARQVEELVDKAINFSDEKTERPKITTKMIAVYLVCIVIGAIGATACDLYYLPPISEGIWVETLLLAAFGAYFMFFAKEHLPEYYDKQKMSLYGDGAFRMNLPGISLSNRNWPYIVESVRTGLLIGTAATPYLFIFWAWILPDGWDWKELYYIPYIIALILFVIIPIYYPAKKYEN